MGRILGIDLGTTNSLIAMYDKGSPQIIPDSKSGEKLLPSAIFFSEDGSIHFGSRARSLGLSSKGVLLTSVKRFMGRGMEDVSEDDRRAYPFTDALSGIIKFRVGQREYTPPELSAYILRALRERAESFLKESVSSVIITVPAYFNDSQRQATKDAGRIAGLDVLRLLNEPTAASLAYGIQKKETGRIAVFDLGGGTFDISILKLKEGLFEVLATNGDTRLGGDDIDNRLALHFLKNYKEELINEREVWNASRAAAEQAKSKLSQEDSAEFILSIPNRSIDFKQDISRKQFEGLVQDIIERTVPICLSALKDAGLKPEEIDDVVMVGGSTRIPFVRARVKEIFRREPHTELNPEEVVALGAAVEASILSGTSEEMLLLDVVPLSLGIETFGGVMSRLIERNTTIPTIAKEIFTTFVDNQTSVDIHVLQGERELVKDNRSLARFQLKPIPPLPAGVPRIEVTFLLDASGLLNVKAKEMRTGQEQGIKVTPSYGLTDEQVEKLLLESIEHAREDVASRLLIQARVDGGTIVAATKKSLKEGADLLASGEKEKIEAAVTALEEAMKGNDHNRIKELIKALDELTIPLAEKIIVRLGPGLT